MVTEINPKKLRKKLIEIYSNYISDNKELVRKAEKDARDLDGMWSGSFLLPEAIENAIGGLTYLYIEPKLSKEKAKKILEELDKNLSEANKNAT